MPTEKLRVMLTIEDEVARDIEDFRFGNRFASRSAAINELIRRGLEAIAQEREAEAEGLRRQLEAAKAEFEADQVDDDEENI